MRKLENLDNEVISDLIKELALDRLPKDFLIDLYKDLDKRIKVQRKNIRSPSLKELKEHSKSLSEENLSKKTNIELRKLYKEMNIGTFGDVPVSKMNKSQLIEAISFHRIHFD